MLGAVIQNPTGNTGSQVTLSTSNPITHYDG